MRVRDLTKRYGDVTALDGVTVEFADGFHCLVGPNGSGKTTLLRTLLGLARPTGGEVHVDGTLGVAFQRPSFYADLTVAENLDVFGGFVGSDDAWVREVVERVGLRDARSRRAGDLSDGYAKKLDLALALAKEPDHLLVDEPLADLDDATRAQLVDLLAGYADDHAVVAATHDLGAFADHCDRLTVLSAGRVRLDRPADAVGDLRDAYLDRVNSPPARDSEKRI